MSKIQELPDSFRQTAEYLREHAASEQAACAWEKAAEKLEEVFKNSKLELLNLEEAEVESGYTRSHLKRLIREGVIPNSGGESEPRIQRRHLPRKPGYRIRQNPRQKVSCRTQAARVIAQGER